MNRITREMFEMIYDKCKKAYNVERNEFNIRKKEEGIEELVNMGCNKGVATMSFQTYERLIKGEVLKINIPKLQLEIFLENIYNDYDNETFKLALNSVKLYLNRYNRINDGKEPHLIREVYEKYLSYL